MSPDPDLERAFRATLGRLVGQRFVHVDYHHDWGWEPTHVPGRCDVTDYGLGVEALGDDGHVRYRIWTPNWFNGNEAGLLAQPGYLEDEFPLETTNPIRRRPATHEARWAPYLETYVARVDASTRGQILYSTAWETPARLEANPRELAFTFEDGRRLHLLTGFYREGQGYQESDLWWLAVCFDDESRERVLAEERG